MPDFVDSQRNQVIGADGSVLAFLSGDDREQRMGEHDQGRVAVPGGPLADLALVEADLALAGLEAFLHTYAYERGGDRGGCPVAVVGPFAVADAAA